LPNLARRPNFRSLFRRCSSHRPGGRAGTGVSQLKRIMSPHPGPSRGKRLEGLTPGISRLKLIKSNKRGVLAVTIVSNAAGFSPATASQLLKRTTPILPTAVAGPGNTPTRICLRSGPQREGAILASIVRCRTAGQSDWPTEETGRSVIGSWDRQRRGSARLRFYGRQARGGGAMLRAFPRLLGGYVGAC
jgi:hypothetical protein